MIDRDANADCSKTGPGPRRGEKMHEVPAWCCAPQEIPTGWRGTLDKDKPAG